jgi:carbonic anhydrase
MRLDDILERNRAFVRGRAAAPLPPPESVPLAVLACYDPRLDGLLGPALGLPDGRAIVLRSAGAAVPSGGDPLRSLGLAAYLFGVRQVLVVGHTSCRMASFETAAFVDAFRARGVRREAFGAGDLRDWAGAIPDPRRGVLASVANIKAATLLPPDLEVTGLLLNDESGALEILVATDSRGAAEPTMFGERPTSAAQKPAPPQAAQRPASAPATHQPATRPDPVPEAAHSLARLLSAARWRDDLRNLRADLDIQRDPFSQIAMVEKFIRKAAGESRAVGEAFERLKREAFPAGRRPGPHEVVELFRRASREAGPGREADQ